MPKIVLLLAFLIIGIFFFYQKQPEMPLPPESYRSVEDAPLKKLKDKLPAVVYEKEILPSIELNSDRGLSRNELTALLSKLENIGRALGGNVNEAVTQAAHAIAPDLFPKKTLAERFAEMAETLRVGAKEGLSIGIPFLKQLVEHTVHALIEALSSILGVAADILQKK